MSDRVEILREAMGATGVSQSQLARMSGVRQPSISQFLSGKLDMSDLQLDRLLSCMGFHLQVSRTLVQPELTRAEKRSWVLHRSLAERLEPEEIELWVPTIEQNLTRLDEGVRGEPHRSNLRRWRALVKERDINGIKRVMTGLDRNAIEMREVSPMGGLLPDKERRELLKAA